MSKIREELYPISEEDSNLANFAPKSIETRRGSDRFETAEHLYQMSKFLPHLKEIREAIKTAATPAEAKAIATEYRDLARPDWNDRNYAIMKGIIRLKIRQNPDVQAELLGTGEKHIIEDADQFAPKNPTNAEIESLRTWGIYQGEGQNWIGKILMDLREELAKNGKVQGQTF